MVPALKELTIYYGKQVIMTKCDTYIAREINCHNDILEEINSASGKNEQLL